MTGIVKIKDRILEEARQLAKANIERAEAEAENILDAAKKKAEDRKRQIREKAEKEAAEIGKRILAVAKLEARKQKLAVRQEMVEEAFNKALMQFELMPEKEYLEMLYGMIVHTVESGNEEIFLCGRDLKRVGPAFVERINRAVADRGLQGNIRLSAQPIEISGGFILKSDLVEINNSFEVILRMKRDKLESEIHQLLF